MKLLISGSKLYTDYTQFKRRVNAILKNTKKEEITIYDDGSKGTAKLARTYCLDEGIKNITIEPDWQGKGKQAGVLRDKQLAQTCTHAILFYYHDETSLTYDVLERMKEYNVKYRLIKVIKDERKTTNHQSPQESIKRHDTGDTHGGDLGKDDQQHDGQGTGDVHPSVGERCTGLSGSDQTVDVDHTDSTEPRQDESSEHQSQPSVSEEDGT